MSFESDKRSEALRVGLSFACKTCGGNWMSNARYIPHATECPNYRGLREDQDAEREALARTGAPFPIRPAHHDVTCPCGCEDRRRDSDFIGGWR